VTRAKPKRKFSNQKGIVTFYFVTGFYMQVPNLDVQISIMPQFWAERNEVFTYRLTSRALTARRSSDRMLLRTTADIPPVGPRHTASVKNPFCGLLPSELTDIFVVFGARGHNPEGRGDRFLMGSLEFFY
jgi:hypothetical protein